MSVMFQFCTCCITQRSFSRPNRGHVALYPDIPAGLIILQERLWNPCRPSDCGPLAQKPSAQVTSDSSTLCQGLKGTGVLSETILYAAKGCINGRIIQMPLKRRSVYPERATATFSCSLLIIRLWLQKSPKLQNCSKVWSVPKRNKLCAAKMKWNKSVLLCSASANAAQLYGIVSEWKSPGNSGATTDRDYRPDQVTKQVILPKMLTIV